MSEITGNKVISSDFMRVLTALKHNINRSLNVAEIGIITETNVDTYTVVPINNSNQKFKCIKLEDLTINKNDIVLVVFTNTDYHINITRINDNIQTQDNPTNDDDLHSINYGVIIGIIKKGE